ncbi:MAG: DUF1573 domain-containing protein [Prevotellaceae bacterium]|jgi:hypothetical protein|nr:DUF1573 domain-containing protein [Prevotellaceae bacterium]
MKKIILSALVCLAFGFAASAQTQKDTTIVFDKLVHDFGNIVQSSGPQTCKFEFTNTGTEPVIIQQVQPSCGCTAPSWTKEPIAPGEKGEILATYNPGGAMPFDKILTVRSNGNPSSIILHIKGVVVAAPQE